MLWGGRNTHTQTNRNTHGVSVRADKKTAIVVLEKTIKSDPHNALNSEKAVAGFNL